MKQPDHIPIQIQENLLKLVDQPWRRTWRFWWDEFSHLFRHEWMMGPENKITCIHCGKTEEELGDASPKDFE